jgi:hypothetical protein
LWKFYIFFRVKLDTTFFHPRVLRPNFFYNPLSSQIFLNVPWSLSRSYNPKLDKIIFFLRLLTQNEPVVSGNVHTEDFLLIPHFTNFFVSNLKSLEVLNPKLDKKFFFEILNPKRANGNVHIEDFLLFPQFSKMKNVVSRFTRKKM